MKKYIKFIRTLIATLLVVVMCFGAVACSGGDQGGNDNNGGGGDNGGNGPIIVTPLPPNEEGGVVSPIVLSKTSLNLIVGDIADPIITSNVGVTWTSLDESIATVKRDASGYGIVEAINEGTTKIVAQFGRASATCDVTVSFDGSVPSISGVFDNFEVKTLAKGGSFKFEPTISYRQREFFDGEFEYSVNDKTIASITEDGVLTVNSNIPADSTIEVTVKGSWRGKTSADSPELVKTYIFNVIDDVFISIDGVEFNQMEIYTSASFEGNTFKNTASFITSVLVNNEKVENAVVTREISNPEFIDYNPDTKVYTGVKYGSGIITLTYMFNNGVEDIPVTTQITYNVLRPYATYTDTVNYFSGISGLVKDDRTSGQLTTKTLAQFIYGPSTEKEIVDAEIVNDYLTSEQKRLTVEENKVLGLDYAADTTLDRQIKVGFEDAVWFLNLKVYGLYITQASEFDYFMLNKATQKINAYVELGCNIDASNFEMREHFVGVQTTDVYLPDHTYSELHAPGFTGVFQGNGYTVTGMATGLYGLFGAMTNATIKNVGFKNCEIDGAAFLTNTMNKCTLENVYIDVAKMSRSSNMLTHTVAGTLVNYGSFKNVLVVNNLTNKYLTDGKLAFAPLYSNKLPTFENVMVISNLELGAIINPTNYATYCLAENRLDENSMNEVLDNYWNIIGALNSGSRDSLFNRYKGVAGNENAVLSQLTGKEILPVVRQVELDKSNPDMQAVANGLTIYDDMAAFVADEDAQAIAKLFSKDYWTLVEGKLTWGSSNINVADGEIFIHLGERANKPVDGLTAQRIKASAGEVELPALSSYGWIFQGYEVVGTGEKITKNAQGKYLFNFSGNGTIVRAIWKQKSNTTTTPIF